MKKYLRMVEICNPPTQTELPVPLILIFPISLDDQSEEFKPSPEAISIIESHREEFAGKNYQFFICITHNRGKPKEIVMMEVSS